MGEVKGFVEAMANMYDAILNAIDLMSNKMRRSIPSDYVEMEGV